MKNVERKLHEKTEWKQSKIRKNEVINKRTSIITSKRLLYL